MITESGASPCVERLAGSGGRVEVGINWCPENGAAADMWLELDLGSEAPVELRSWRIGALISKRLVALLHRFAISSRSLARASEHHQ